MAGEVTEIRWGKSCGREIPGYYNKYLARNNFGTLRVRLMSPIMCLFRDAETVAEHPSEFSVKCSTSRLRQLRYSELEASVRVLGYPAFGYSDGPLPFPSSFFNGRMRTEFKKIFCNGPLDGIIPCIFKGPSQAKTGRWVARPTMFTQAKSTIRNTFKQLKANAVGGQI